jgi:hypothetical protein
MATQNIALRPGYKIVLTASFNTSLTDRIKVEDYLTGARVKLIQNKPWVFPPLNEADADFEHRNWESPRNDTEQIRIYAVSAETARRFYWLPTPSSVLYESENHLNFLYGWQDQENGSFSSAATNISLVRVD